MVSNILGLPVETRAQNTAISSQVVNVSQQMQIGQANSISVGSPRAMSNDLTALRGSGSPAQTEEALRCLGQYLGLDSTRPDKEFDVGPDVLWIGEQGVAICMEVKTEKQTNSNYRKEETGQLHNHIQWVKDNYEVTDIIPIFVGPLLPATDPASPTPEMRVVELKQFENLAQQLAAAMEDVALEAFPLSLEADLQNVMKSRGLLFPGVFALLETNKLQEMP